MVKNRDYSDAWALLNSERENYPDRDVSVVLTMIAGLLTERRRSTLASGYTIDEANDVGKLCVETREADRVAASIGRLSVPDGLPPDVRPWEITFDEYLHSFPLPPQRKIPEEGRFNAVKTDDGGLYFGEESHWYVIKKNHVPPERVVNGGVIDNGVYEELSDVAKGGGIDFVPSFARQIRRDKHRQYVEQALRDGQDVPDAVLQEYPDLETSKESAMVNERDGMGDLRERSVVEPFFCAECGDRMGWVEGSAADIGEGIFCNACSKGGGAARGQPFFCSSCGERIGWTGGIGDRVGQGQSLFCNHCRTGVAEGRTRRRGADDDNPKCEKCGGPTDATKGYVNELCRKCRAELKRAEREEAPVSGREKVTEREADADIRQRGGLGLAAQDADDEARALLGSMTSEQRKNHSYGFNLARTKPCGCPMCKLLDDEDIKEAVDPEGADRPGWWSDRNDCHYRGCGRPATQTLYRKSMIDENGLGMCDAHAAELLRDDAENWSEEPTDPTAEGVTEAASSTQPEIEVDPKIKGKLLDNSDSHSGVYEQMNDEFEDVLDWVESKLVKNFRGRIWRIYIENVELVTNPHGRSEYNTYEASGTFMDDDGREYRFMVSNIEMGPSRALNGIGITVSIDAIEEEPVEQEESTIKGGTKVYRGRDGVVSEGGVLPDEPVEDAVYSFNDPNPARDFIVIVRQLGMTARMYREGMDLKVLVTGMSADDAAGDLDVLAGEYGGVSVNESILSETGKSIYVGFVKASSVPGSSSSAKKHYAKITHNEDALPPDVTKYTVVRNVQDAMLWIQDMEDRYSDLVADVDSTEVDRDADVTESTLSETGEPDQDYDHATYDAIVKALEKHGYEATHREFDKYQGVYLTVTGGGVHEKFWTVEGYGRGEREGALPKYSKAWLEDAEGERFSATRGDYFMADPSKPLGAGLVLVTVDQQGKVEEKENPTVNDLPADGDVEHSIAFKKGTVHDVLVMVPEGDADVKIEVDVFNGEADVDAMVDYLAGKQGVVGESKTSLDAAKTAISKMKDRLRGRWSETGAMENFGAKEAQLLRDRYEDSSDYSSEGKAIRDELRAFSAWCENYTGADKTESAIGEAKAGIKVYVRGGAVEDVKAPAGVNVQVDDLDGDEPKTTVWKDGESYAMADGFAEPIVAVIEVKDGVATVDGKPDMPVEIVDADVAESKGAIGERGSRLARAMGRMPERTIVEIGVEERTFGRPQDIGKWMAYTLTSDGQKSYDTDPIDREEAIGFARRRVAQLEQAGTKVKLNIPGEPPRVAESSVADNLSLLVQSGSIDADTAKAISEALKG
jgi:hypothetical protein